MRIDASEHAAAAMKKHDRGQGLGMDAVRLVDAKRQRSVRSRQRSVLDPTDRLILDIEGLRQPAEAVAHLLRRQLRYAGLSAGGQHVENFPRTRIDPPGGAGEALEGMPLRWRVTWRRRRREPLLSTSYQFQLRSEVTRASIDAIDRKLAGVMKASGMLMSSSDSTERTSSTMSSDVRPTLVRSSCGDTSRLIE